MTDCAVCYEPYTKTVRKRVECGHCGTACCSTCFQKYLLTLQGDPHCMGCKRRFDGEFLAMATSKTWLLGTYKTHREAVLLERELAMLPATQDVLQNYRHCQHLYRELMQVDGAKRDLHRQLEDLNRRSATLRTHIDVLQRSNYVNRPDDATRTARERRQFIRACPVEGCRGFLSTAWKCGTCDVKVCKDCGEPADEDHECNPDIAASHAMMQRDSRPCPQCAAMIFKLSGCDQMFCTQCHVAFSWRTGQVVTNGVIHNPHYYEWLRRTRGEVPRNPGDVPCGGLPSIHDIEPIIRREASAEEARVIRTTHRSLRHVQIVELPAMRREATTDENRNVDLRLQYLLNNLTREHWKKKLQQREKRRERAFAVMQVYETFVAAATDMFRAMADRTLGPPHMVRDLTRLRAFTNESLDDISKRFNMRVKRLRD